MLLKLLKCGHIFSYYCILLFIASQATSIQHEESQYPSDFPADIKSPKLLIMVIDGFRWDYYSLHKQQLPGFRQFLSEGVQAEYVEPIFPSLSYPSWTTLTTGLYPSSHNIVGNYMLRLQDDEFPEAIFQLKDNSSKSTWWWQFAEPLWITATKAGNKAYLANFANCDVAYHNLYPTECTGYQYKDFNFKLREHLTRSIERFKHGYSLAMVYDDSIDHAGHTGGPESSELRVALLRLDAILQEFLANLKYQGLHEKVNVVITSDHGMSSIKKDSGIEFIKLENYISNKDDVYKVIDYGAVVSIAAASEKSDSLYEDLLKMPGVNVYKRENIPNDFHYKESKLAHDILLVARPGFFIVGLKGDKQIPSDSKASSVQPYAASHGYSNMTDMRTIFYARGPAFRRGLVHPPIKLVDQYQIFAKVLELNPCDNNGTWENISKMINTFE